MQLPPYGLMLAGDLDQGKRPKPPHDWVPPAGTPGADRREQWKNWIEEQMEVITEVLWPRWNYRMNEWTPGAAYDRMHALTEADFQVMDAMEKKFDGRGLDTFPDPPNRTDDPRRHRQHFILEDNRGLDDKSLPAPIGTHYSQYDRKMPEDLLKRVVPFFGAAMRNKGGASMFPFKFQLQRPRAFQVALFFDRPDFVVNLGITAATPAMCSGHCLQGMIGGGGVFEGFLHDNIQLDSQARESLMQFTVDVGDRRVMAGVHYPSDNLCSWFLALKMADSVFRSKETKRFMWDAIQQSTVYQEILAYDEGENSVFHPALVRIQKAADGAREAACE